MTDGNDKNNEDIRDDIIKNARECADKHSANDSFFFYGAISLAIYTIMLGYSSYNLNLDLVYRAILMIGVSYLLLKCKGDSKKWGILYVACFIHSIVSIFIAKKMVSYILINAVNMVGCLIIVMICDGIFTHSLKLKHKIMTISAMAIILARIINLAIFILDITSRGFILYLKNPVFYIANIIINLITYALPAIIILIHPEYIAVPGLSGDQNITTED